MCEFEILISQNLNYSTFSKREDGPVVKMEEVLNSVRAKMRHNAETAVHARRPFVTLTYAQSLDGCIAASKNERLTLSCSKAMTMTHELRATHQAILVGVQTVYIDNPRLNARLSRQVKSPIPIILDTHCRVSPQAALFNKELHEQVIVYTGPLNGDGLNRKNILLQNTNARVHSLGVNKDRRVNLRAVLTDLHDRGIHTLMVEGGSRVLTSFLEHLNLIDLTVLTICPVYIGRGVPGVVDNKSLLKNGSFPCIERPQWSIVGTDAVLYGSLTYNSSSSLS